jgi:hypothetical protein
MSKTISGVPDRVPSAVFCSKRLGANVVVTSYSHPHADGPHTFWGEGPDGLDIGHPQLRVGLDHARPTEVGFWQLCGVDPIEELWN